VPGAGPSQRRQLAPTKSAVPGNDDKDPVPPGIELLCKLPQFGVRKRVGSFPWTLGKRIPVAGLRGIALSCTAESKARRKTPSE
jgi:hypothetical protein